MLQKINKDLKVIKSLQENYQITDKQIDMLELFLNGRWECSLNDLTDDKIKTHLSQCKSIEDEEKLMTMIDINDFCLRVQQDDAVIEKDVDDLAEIFIRKLFECKSRNDYDFNFIYYNMNREKFVKDIMDQKIFPAYNYSENGYFVNTYEV